MYHQMYVKVVHRHMHLPFHGALCHQDAELFPQFDVDPAFALIVESIDPRNRSTFLRKLSCHKSRRNMFLRKIHTGSHLLQPEISRWMKTGIKNLRQITWFPRSKKKFSGYLTWNKEIMKMKITKRKEEMERLQLVDIAITI